MVHSLVAKAPVTRLLEFRPINGTNTESGSSPNVPAAVESQASDAPAVQRALTEADAIEIWIGRWLRIRRKDLAVRHGCDPKRLYEIWWGERFPASREKAVREFKARYPGLIERTSFGYRRIPRLPTRPEGHPLDLFS